MSNDLHIFGRTIMCPKGQILTGIKVFCKRNPLKAIITSIHGLGEFTYVFFFLTFQSDFIDFYVNKKKTLKKITFFFFQFSLFWICLEFRKIYTNALMACLMLAWRWMLLLWILDVLRVLFDTLSNVFKQQGVRKIDHLEGVRGSRSEAKTAIFGTPTCTIASKLPQLQLLTPMVHITTVYLPKLCVIARARVD